MYAVIVIMFFACIIALGYLKVRESSATGSWKIKDSSRDIAQYNRELAGIRNKYVSAAPKYDSIGSFSCFGSITDQTGIFDPMYKAEVNRLDERYGRVGSTTYEEVQVNKEAWENGERW